MARIIRSADIVNPESRNSISKEGKLWTYCAFDSMLTHEVETEQLARDKDPNYALVYKFERALQGPILQMMTRGLLIDEQERKRLYDIIWTRRERVTWVFDKLCLMVCGHSVNPRSHQQLKSLFYESMGIKPIVKSFKGVRRVTVNDEALEELQDYFYAKPLAKCIIQIRELGGYLNVLKSRIDSDGRMRMAYNIGGADTGRLSSSKNHFGGGTNAQNITEEMRRIFIADEGMKLAYLDLPQAESRAVAYSSGDEKYREACESGDLHTAVCRMIWPDKPYTGDIEKDRDLVETLKFDTIHSFRYVSKQCGHASNYLASAHTIAKLSKLPKHRCEVFQSGYFKIFNVVPEWHKEIQRELGKNCFLINALGRKRRFLGRVYDDVTLRVATAFLCQSLIADILNFGLLRLYYHMDLPGLLQLLAQIHDAVLIQYPEDRESVVIPQAISLMTVPVLVRGKVMAIAPECKVGYNWRDLEKVGSPEAQAQVRPKKVDFLDRTF